MDGDRLHHRAGKVGDRVAAVIGYQLPNGLKAFGVRRGRYDVVLPMPGFAFVGRGWCSEVENALGRLARVV
ncbi:hypothetical protein [Burkholderia pseudomallei]|uniref:hypothetical protein n=1 Tax=Burkholderia pseudomallei TaxID=28450 RepID=UPI003879CB18